MKTSWFLDNQDVYPQFANIFHCIMDDDSMAGRATFAWITHHLEEGRCVSQDMVVHVQIDPRLSSEVANCAFGGIPVIYSLGDCHQLPPVGDKPMYASVAPNNLILAEACDNIAFSSFLTPNKNYGTNDITIIMDEVIRQRNPQSQLEENSCCL
jgi:hypothetical protein